LKRNLVRLGIVAAIGLLVFAAACGGDDDDDGGDSTPVSQATSASTAASTAAATVAANPTPAPDDGGDSGEQQFSDMSPESQSGVNTLCRIAADPVAGLSQATNIEITLQAAQAGQYGAAIGEAAGPFAEAYAGTDTAAFDSAVAGLKAACDDIGWTAQ
jgi:hypothetical protein